MTRTSDDHDFATSTTQHDTTGMTGSDADTTAATSDASPIEELKIATTSHDDLLNGGPRDKNGKPRKPFAN